MPGRWVRSALAAAESVMFRLIGLAGRPGSPWVGRRALFRAELPPWADDPPGDDRAWFRVYTVVADDGASFELSADGRSGWAGPGELLFLDGADDGIAAPDVGPDVALIQTLMVRGARSWGAGRRDRALADFGEVIRLDPGHASAWISRGEARSHLGDHDGALADLDAAVARNPGDAAALAARASIRSRRGEDGPAAADAEASLRLRPTPIAHNVRGCARLRAGDRDGARADFDAALRLNPRSADALTNRALLHIQAQEYHQARAVADLAVRAAPGSALALNHRGLALARLRDYAGALADYDEVLDLDPENVTARNNRAWLRATCPDPSLRDGARALDDATRACESTPEPTAFHLGTLAAAHAEVGDFARAAEWQARANELYDDPEDKARGRSRHAGYVAGRPHRDEEW